MRCCCRNGAGLSDVVCVFLAVLVPSDLGQWRGRYFRMFMIAPKDSVDSQP